MINSFVKITIIYFIVIFINFNVINSAQDQTDWVKRIITIRTIDAHVRQFLDKIDDIKRLGAELKDQYNCITKDKGSLKCEKIGCLTTKECLHTIFAQFQKVLDPIMLNLIGTIKGGELKPGSITALPLLWSEPRPANVKKMQDILVNNIAINFNDLYNFFGLMSKSLDPNLKFEEKKNTVPVAVPEPTPSSGPSSTEQASTDQTSDQIVKKKKKRKKKKKAAESATTDSNTPNTAPA